MRGIHHMLGLVFWRPRGGTELKNEGQRGPKRTTWVITSFGIGSRNSSLCFPLAVCLETLSAHLRTKGK